MNHLYKAVRLLLLSVTAVLLAQAQANQPGPDTIIFTNGDKLVGHFVRSTDAAVTFNSDALGSLTIDWKKVKELETSTKVALIRKGVTLRRKQTPADVPQGTLAMHEQNLQITPAPGAAPQSIPIADSAVVIDQGAFEKAMTRTPSLLSDWTGTLTAGGSIVQATQDNRTFTGALSLTRAEPTEDWLNPSYRTIFGLSESYGELTQPGTPTITTSIFHAGVEQDKYFTPAVFVFGLGAFDHNNSQGLELQQTYSGGIGWTVVKTAVQELDLKAGVSYIRQSFIASPGLAEAPDMNLIGSVFAEHYHRKLVHNMQLDENLSATPTWNDTSAYSGFFNALLTIPVFKRLGGSAGVSDTFLNDPPLGFKKNSLTLTLGVTYAFQ